MSEAYLLYGGKYTRALVNEMLMLEANISYSLREVDIVNNEHLSTEYLSINPAGLVPCLVTSDGQRIAETPAINLYLVDHHRLSSLAPLSDEPERGEFLSVLFFIHGEIEPAMKRYYYPHRYSPSESDISQIRQQALQNAVDKMAVIDERLQQRGPYILGDRFSLVDITLAYWFTSIRHEPEAAPLTSILHCLELVSAREKLCELFTKLESSIREYAGLQVTGTGFN